MSTDTTPESNAPETESFIELSEGFLVGGGRYSLVQSLGQGGMGMVWLARDERLGQLVALKFVQLQSNPLVLDDLRRETARSLKLTHSNIVRIYDFYEAPDEVAFISMEHVDGSNLHSLRAQQPDEVFTWNFLKPLIKQLCEALEYAHGENVIHRDLKPSNMMLDAKGRLKLADFGIAAARSDPLQAYYKRHAASGTITHMSPQQMAGHPATVADDIYALGATLYDLLTGTTPFNTGDIPEQVQNSFVEPLSIRLGKLKLANEVPPHVAAMIMACLAKDPAQRPPSATAVADWIGFNSVAAPIRVTAIAAPFSGERTAPEPKTRRGLTVVPLPLLVPVQVAAPEKTVEMPLTIPESAKIPTQKVVMWAGGIVALIVVYGIIAKLVFSGAVPPITSIPDGSAAMDPTFQTKATIDNFIRSVAVQPDGKIVLGGGFENVDGVECKRIARLNADGTFDKDFAAALNNIVYSVAAQNDGKILLGGDFTDVSGQVCKGVARLASDGSFDPEFRRTTDTAGTIRTISLQPDGRILIAGDFQMIEGVKKNHIARLKADGSLDERFKADANGVIWPVTIQSDDKILIGGDFTTVGAVKRHRIARLNSDGQLDQEFDTGTGANKWVYAIAVQKDGRIVIGGDFTEFNGRPRNRVARLESDGSLDATFTPGAGPDSGIRSIVIQADQKILLGGVFKYFNDTPLNHIARLNFNGSVDASFDSGTGFDHVVRTLALQKDGKILVAGHFTNYNGAACNRIARLQGAAGKVKK